MASLGGKKPKPVHERESGKSSYQDRSVSVVLQKQKSDNRRPG